MSTFEKLVLEFLREIRTDLRIGIVEMKRSNSWDSRNHDLLEMINRSLSNGEFSGDHDRDKFTGSDDARYADRGL